MNTEMETVSAYRPSPLATWDGDYVTPAQYLTRWMVDGGWDWLRMYGTRKVLPVVREIDAAEGTRREWVVVDAETGRIAPNFTGAYDLPNPIDPNHTHLVRVDTGFAGVEWHHIHYSIGRGWTWGEFADVYEYHETRDDEGYPRLCDSERHSWDGEIDPYDDEAEISDDEIAASGGVFADYCDDGTDLCAECFDRLYGGVHYIHNHRAGSLRETVASGVWDEADDIERHCVATGMGVYSEPVTRNQWVVGGMFAVEATNADRFTYYRASGRFSALLRERAEIAENRHLEYAGSLYESGEIDRDTGLAAGLGETWLNLTDEIMETTKRMEARVEHGGWKGKGNE